MKEYMDIQKKKPKRGVKTTKKMVPIKRNKT